MGQSNQNQKNPNNTQRYCPLQIRAMDEESRVVELSFSSEQAVERWFGSEILCHDEGCMKLDRLKEIGSVLFHHGYDQNYGSLPIAKIVDISLDETEHKGRAKISFDTDEKSDLIFQKVKSGSVKGISVGYQIDRYEDVKAGAISTNGRFKGPCRVATSWTPLEISIEPVPADDNVGIGRSLEPESEENNMADTNNQVQQPESTTRNNQTPPQTQENTNNAVAAERQRSAEIYSLCREFNVEDEQIRGYIQDGSTVDDVRTAILEGMRQTRKPITAHTITGGGEDGEERYRAAARDGVLLRMGYTVEKPADGANTFRNMSLHQLLADCACRSGVSDVHMKDPETLWRDMANQCRGQFADKNSFVSIINSSMNGVIQNAYTTAPTTYQRWTGTGSNSDFKPTKRYRLAASGEMEEIPENGEFKSVFGMDEEVDTRIKTYGKKFGISRQTIINDELGTVARMITAQVRANQRFINKKCYEILFSSAKIFDGKKLFDEAHHNLFTGAAPSVASLNEMIVAMAKQVDINGTDVLNLKPHFILAPVALKMTLRQLLCSTSNPEAANSGVMNPVQSEFELITDACLDVQNPKGFFAVADPRDGDSIEVTYLNGKKEPFLESRASWDTLGIEWRMYHDFGINIIDYRGVSYNPGK